MKWWACANAWSGAVAPSHRGACPRAIRRRPPASSPITAASSGSTFAAPPRQPRRRRRRPRSGPASARSVVKPPSPRPWRTSGRSSCGPRPIAARPSASHDQPPPRARRPSVPNSLVRRHGHEHRMMAMATTMSRPLMYITRMCASLCPPQPTVVLGHHRQSRVVTPERRPSRGHIVGGGSTSKPGPARCWADPPAGRCGHATSHGRSLEEPDDAHLLAVDDHALADETPDEAAASGHGDVAGLTGGETVDSIGSLGLEPAGPPRPAPR